MASDATTNRPAPKVGDRFVVFDGTAAGVETVAYYEILSGPLPSEEYEAEYEMTRRSERREGILSGDYCERGPIHPCRVYLSPDQWERCRAAGFPEDIQEFFTALDDAPSGTLEMEHDAAEDPDGWLQEFTDKYLLIRSDGSPNPRFERLLSLLDSETLERAGQTVRTIFEKKRPRNRVEGPDGKR